MAARSVGKPGELETIWVQTTWVNFALPLVEPSPVRFPSTALVPAEQRKPDVRFVCIMVSVLPEKSAVAGGSQM